MTDNRLLDALDPTLTAMGYSRRTHPKAIARPSPAERGVMGVS